MIPLTYVGEGFCQNSNGQQYNTAVRLTNNTGQEGLSQTTANAAFAWCQTAQAVKSSLVGVRIGTDGYWVCNYDNGTINGIDKTEFDPDANGYGLFTSYTGSGAVSYASGHPNFACYRNEVCPNVPNCRLCFSSLTAFPNSLPLYLRIMCH